MTPYAAFFGFFMAAVLNLPERPLPEKVLLMLVFLGIVVVERMADGRQKQFNKIYPYFKAAICFLSFVALSLVYTDHLIEQPLRAFGILVGGILFAMVIYMQARFQKADRKRSQAYSFGRPPREDGQ
jgi:predicted tellurium resistance membrane protein TerC